MSTTAIPWTKGACLSREAEHSLIERALGGDRDAFARLVEEHRPMVSRLARRLLGWDAQADDVVQEVFVRLWLRRGQLREAEKLRGWLASVTVNAARQHVRRETVRRALMLRLRREKAAGPVAASDGGPAMEREEHRRQVRDAVNALPRRDREVLVLGYLEGMAVGEVARVLGVKVNTVEVRLHRARKRLAEQLPEELRF